MQGSASCTSKPACKRGGCPLHQRAANQMVVPSALAIYSNTLPRTCLACHQWPEELVSHGTMSDQESHPPMAAIVERPGARWTSSAERTCSWRPAPSCSMPRMCSSTARPLVRQRARAPHDTAKNRQQGKSSLRHRRLQWAFAMRPGRAPTAQAHTTIGGTSIRVDEAERSGNSRPARHSKASVKRRI